MTGDSQLTMAGVAIGTPAYMPPEQIEGASLDARGDIYSLGLVAWEMLTGHRPWEGESLYAILYRQRYEQLPDVRELRDDVPDSLGDADFRRHRKGSAMRWQSAEQMIEALDGAGPARPTTRRPPLSADTVRFARPAGGVPPSNPEMAEPLAGLPPMPLPAITRAERSAVLAGPRRAATPERSIRRVGPRVNSALARRERAVVHRIGRVRVACRRDRGSGRRAAARDEPPVRHRVGWCRRCGHARGWSRQTCKGGQMTRTARRFSLPAVSS